MLKQFSIKQFSLFKYKFNVKNSFISNNSI